MINSIKRLVLPNRPVRCPILFGPLRGARPLMNPQASVRYMLGLYEHELNGWLTKAIPRVTSLFDIGANHGYFCLGVMAAWYRLKIEGSVWAFEPQPEEIDRILKGKIEQHGLKSNLVIEKCFVGSIEDANTIVIDRYLQQMGFDPSINRSMVKIDVEGAEMEVLQGAKSLAVAGNLFLVEVHSATLLDEVQAFFRLCNHATEVVHQSPLPVIGRESRSLENWWVVSKL
ncbi:MAG: FkbM family methyltransferase [Planctomycetota bacterium]